MRGSAGASGRRELRTMRHTLGDPRKDPQDFTKSWRSSNSRDGSGERLSDNIEGNSLRNSSTTTMGKSLS